MRKFLELVGLIVVLVLVAKVVFSFVLPLLGWALKLLLVGGIIYLGFRAFRYVVGRLEGRESRRRLRP